MTDSEAHAMNRSFPRRAGALATLAVSLVLVVVSLGGQSAPTAVEWRFDEPQPGWTVSVPRPFPPDIQPPTVSRTDDALRVTLGPSNAISDGRLLGGVHVDVPAWDYRDWAYVEIRVRSSGPGGVTLGFNIWKREGHPQEGLPRPYEMRGLAPTTLVADSAVRTYRVPFVPRDREWQAPVNQLALWFNTLGDSLTVDILSVKVVPAGASRTAPPSSTAAARPDDGPPWIMAAVPFAPIPFASDAGTALVYELHVNNLSARDVTLRRVDVLSRNGDRLRSYEGSLLAPNLQRVGASARQEGSLVAAGSLAVVWVWLIVEDDAAVPDSIRHQLTIDYGDEGTADSIVVEARPAAPRADAMELGPPLRGGGWKAGGISESEGHRRGLAEAGHVSQRFATDYSRVDQFGRGSTGDPFVLESNYGFGADVLAVGDGVIISAHDGMPESAVGPQPRRTPPASLGNYVELDLGDGVTASYLHLQSGSVRVRAGDAVTRGQVIARVGNSGASTGPHLHFQLNDATGEGIPYVHPTYERIGFDGIPYCRCSGLKCTATPPVRRARQMPADDVVVRFPDGPDGLSTEPAVSPAHMRAICRAREAERLVEADRIGDALDAYADARTLDSTLTVPGAAWRRLCWLGSLAGRAAEVLSVCELAVAQEPGYGSHLSPRGVARALTGDRAGAIEDLEAYLVWETENRRSAGHQALLDGLAAGASLRPQIQGWLDALRAGDDPFTPELLEELRQRPLAMGAGVPAGPAAALEMRKDAAAVAAAEALQAPTGVTVFRDVRLFDGVSIVEPATVVVKDGRIESVSEVPVLPADATVVDGKGLTLLPGLIDAHTHASARRPWLEQALIFGVTTVLDLFSAPAFVAPIREEQSTSGALGRADVYSAGHLVTAPGGHGTELGSRVPTISNPAEAQRFVDARIAEGSDYIKIVYDCYGTASNDALPTWRGRLPSIDRATLAAVIGAAHARGKLAVVHVLNLESARHAVAAGADGLAHMFVDERPDREFLAEAVRNDVFIIPTLSLLRGYTGVAKPQVVADPRVTAYLPPMSEAQLRIIGTMAHEIPDPEARLELLDASVAMLRRAGVRLLAGTDVPNPGTTHGAGLHEELAALVDAGLSPLDALRAATSDVARAFRLTDRGRIEPGLRADLLLVRGDPSVDIGAARDIVGVWKLGVQVDREAYRARYAPARSAYEAFVEALGSPGVTPLADFEHDEKMPTAVVGTWAPYSDIAYGGHSTSALSVVDKGAAGSAKSLLIRGSTVANEPFAGTGALYWPFGPVDLSSKSEIVFWAKGDRATYRIIMSNAGLTEVPVPQTFEVDDEWTEIVIPLSGFVGVDRRAVVTFAFLGSASPGEFLLQIDELRLR